MMGYCSLFDKPLPISVLDQCASLYQLLSCMRCGILSDDVYVNQECQHFLCGKCLQNVPRSKVECRCVNFCEGEKAKPCTKFFTAENMKSELFLNERAKMVRIAFEMHKIPMQHVLDLVKKKRFESVDKVESVKGIGRFQLDDETPDADPSCEREMECSSSEDDPPLFQKLGSPVENSQRINEEAKENAEARSSSSDDAMTSKAIQVDQKARSIFDTGQNVEPCKSDAENDEHFGRLPKKFSIGGDSDNDEDASSKVARELEAEQQKSVFDITMSQPTPESADSPQKGVKLKSSSTGKNKSLESTHKFFNTDKFVIKKPSKVTAPQTLGVKSSRVGPKLADHVTIAKKAPVVRRSSGSTNSRVLKSTTLVNKNNTSTPLASFEVTSASSSGEDSVYGGVMRTARKALSSPPGAKTIANAAATPTVGGGLSEAGRGPINTSGKCTADSSVLDKSAVVANNAKHSPIGDSSCDEFNMPCASTTSSIDATIRRLSRRNGRGETELHCESRKGNLHRVCQLLHEGADPNTKDNIDLRPLHEHKALQNVEVCRALLEYGADPCVHGGERNDTPLHVAVQNDFVHAIPLLIQWGADIHAKAKTEDGRVYTPLSVAKFFGKHEVVALLESETAKRDRQNSTSGGGGGGDPPSTPLRTPKLNLSEAMLQMDSPKQMHIYSFTTTSLNNIDKSNCQEFARQFKLRVWGEYDKQCQALVLSRKADTRLYPRTAKAMFAVLHNGVLIDMEWVNHSLHAQKLLPFRTYLVNTLSQCTDGVKRAREAHCDGRKLFSGLKAYLKPGVQDAGLSSADLKSLLTSGGAKLLTREPKLDTLHEIIDEESPVFIDENSPISDLRVVMVNSISAFENGKHCVQFVQGLYHVSLHWLISSICTFSMDRDVD